MGKLKDYEGQSESNTSYILSPNIPFLFYGNNHHISEVLEHNHIIIVTTVLLDTW